MMTALIICIGNRLAADDGAGHAVYERLNERCARMMNDRVRLEFIGLGGIDLLEQCAGEEQLIVVDAVQLGAPAGTVHVLEWDQLPAMNLRPVSGHGIGVREAVEVGRRLYPETIPTRITLVGVEGECFDQLGEWLSPAVEEAIEPAVEAVCSLLDR